MWWYRDREADGEARPDEGTARADALVAPLGGCALGENPLRAACVAMAVLVDHEVSWTDDAAVLRLSWQDAEALVQRAFEAHDLSRLYNDFARDFGDGYTDRSDLPDDDRSLVDAVLGALRATEGVDEVRRRPPPTAEVEP